MKRVDKEYNMVETKNVVVVLSNYRDYKTYHARKLTDRDKLDHIYYEINTMNGNELDDCAKRYIEMLSSGVTVFDMIDEI